MHYTNEPVPRESEKNRIEKGFFEEQRSEEQRGKWVTFAPTKCAWRLRRIKNKTWTLARHTRWLNKNSYLGIWPHHKQFGLITNKYSMGYWIHSVGEATF